MARPPLARERVLDAYEQILVSEGERAATLEAVAKAAGVSKGGLLYHFAAKEDLSTGLLQRLDALVTEDVELMKQAPEGPIAYYVRTSVMEGDALDRAITAASRLAQGGQADAVVALREMRMLWETTLRPAVRDETALQLVMLLSDGLYYNNALDGTGDLSTPTPRDGALEKLIELVERTVT
ncbi:Transcriptional regulator, TetR family [Microbacterium esteraromaticum]|uniref:Transcriptional regulator, TetR family n=1 Tax=Microbacterium esteraromaticum TaxID=57043 RepID=A0A1R4JMI7_9MICO|nr:TetR/AcrR family transcriptional regulator [Microbacterium esteraromaticum]SJN33236.1 Transcriptional regulator, TetR family [Microbacterium esteraromaticum]